MLNPFERRCEICGATAVQGVLDVAQLKNGGGPRAIATDDPIKYRCARHPAHSRTFEVTASEFLRLQRRAK